MMRMLQSRWGELVIRYVVGITFIYASIHKIAEPAEFAKIIYGYGLFPHVSINLIAIVLPFLELFAGAALLLGVYPRSAAIWIGIMLMAFIIAISINLIRGYEFDCGCFSFGGSEKVYGNQQLLLRDLLYLIFCAYLIAYPRKRFLCIGKTVSM